MAIGHFRGAAHRIPGADAKDFLRFRAVTKLTKTPLRSTFGILPPGLERYNFSWNRHAALSFCWSMIFSENR
jgi:hypothetical protein